MTLSSDTDCARAVIVCYCRKNSLTLSHSRLILNLSTMVLLASCEPGDSGGTAIRPGNEGERWVPRVDNRANSERLFAHASLGQAPLPRNLVTDVEDICTVHRQKMQIREVPIVFDESALGLVPQGDSIAAARFPFGAEKIFSPGNALLPGEPVSALVYQCTDCIAERKLIEADRQAIKPPAPMAAFK